VRVFIAVGCAGRLRVAHRSAARGVVACLFWRGPWAGRIPLCFSDYIRFATSFAGGAENGPRLLSYLSLDWGRLKLLAKWQRMTT